MSTQPFLTDTSKGRGALFNIAADDRRDNGPVMSGSVDVEGFDQRVHVSGFMRTATTNGANYLSLALNTPLPEGYTEQDTQNQLRYYGKLFRQTEKRSDASPDYTGFISVLPCTQPNQYSDDEWDAAPTLQIFAWRRRSTDGSSRIAMNIAPRHVDEAELNF